MPSQAVGSAADPFVRIVVLNWNSAWFTRRCVRSLQQTDYPSDRFEVVLVDNGSIDGSLELLRRELPGVRIISNGVNLGFAEGCNRGMRDRDGVDHVALINNDTVVDPGWLRSLVDVMESDPGVGAVAARLLLEPGFVPVDVAAAGTVSLERVAVDGVDVTGALRLDGFEACSAADWPLDITFRLTDAGARIWVPAGAEAREIAVSVLGPGHLTREPGGVAVGPDRRSFVVSAPAARTQLMNGLGTALNERCEGYDIGYGDVDRDDLVSTEVDGFCGGGALLRAAMLDEVGLFDPRWFAYYEDSDMSWRARRAGWRIVTAPDAVIHHAFGASAGSRAAGFYYLDRRNWWLTTERNGTPDQVAVVRATAMRSVRAAFRANVLARVRHGRPPSFHLLAAWVRIALDVALERRRFTAAGTPVGANPVSSVSGRFQPRPCPRPPTPRPWGPQLVYLDVTDALAGEWVGPATLVGRILTLCSRIESLDVVPFIRRSDRSMRRVASDEMATLLPTGARWRPPRRSDVPVDGVASGGVGVARRRVRRDLRRGRWAEDLSPLELEELAVGSVELVVEADAALPSIPNAGATVPRVSVVASDGTSPRSVDPESGTFVVAAASFDETAASDLATLLVRVGRAAWTAHVEQCRGHPETAV